MSTRLKTVLFGVAVLLFAAVLFVLLAPGEDESAPMTAQSAYLTEKPPVSNRTLVRTGSSLASDPVAATREVLARVASDDQDPRPQLAILLASNFQSLEQIYAEARRILGPSTRIFGGSASTRAIMTEKGLLSVGPGASSPTGLVAMIIRSSEIGFGVGSASPTHGASRRETTRRAVEEAVRDARKPGKQPSALLVLADPKEGEGVARGLDDVLGKSVPVAGGCVSGPSNSVIGNAVRTLGVAALALYTDLPMGWTFEGGFDVSDAHSGQVTAVSEDGRIVETIDGRPATDVYNEWTQGQVARLYPSHTPGNVIDAIDALTLYPCYRKFRSPDGRVYTIFSHAWPADPTLTNRSLQLASSVEKGDRLYLGRGSWETLLNRIGNLPAKAKLQAGMDAGDRTILGIGFICSGVFGSIPRAERGKIPVLLNYSHGGAPFVGMVTAGEFGNLPGIGNKYGNLLTSFLTVGPKTLK
ncbi:MAG: FIST signal transduction protein [Acidobacteriota bacterium]